MEDEIVAEIRRIRDQIAARCNNDLDQIYQYFRKLQRESGREYVNLVKRPKKRKKTRA